MTPAFLVNNLSIMAGTKILLDQLNLTIPSQEISLLLGANGAGKTLLLRSLAGLVKPHRGEVRGADSQALHSKPKIELARLLHWMPVSAALPFDFTVREILLMGRYALHQGYPSSTDHMAVAGALERMALQDFANRIYNGLSRGEQTRVDIARALAADAPILLLDEPFANLDIDASLQLILLLHDLRRNGKTIVLSHHDLYSVRELGTYLIYLKQGRLIAEGSCQDMFSQDNIRQTFAVTMSFLEDPEHKVPFVRFQTLEKQL